MDKKTKGEDQNRFEEAIKQLLNVPLKKQTEKRINRPVTGFCTRLGDGLF